MSSKNITGLNSHIPYAVNMPRPLGVNRKDQIGRTPSGPVDPEEIRLMKEYVKNRASFLQTLSDLKSSLQGQRGLPDVEGQDKIIENINMLRRKYLDSLERIYTYRLRRPMTPWKGKRAAFAYAQDAELARLLGMDEAAQKKSQQMFKEIINLCDDAWKKYQEQADIKEDAVERIKELETNKGKRVKDKRYYSEKWLLPAWIAAQLGGVDSPTIQKISEEIARLQDKDELPTIRKVRWAILG